MIYRLCVILWLPALLYAVPQFGLQEGASSFQFLKKHASPRLVGLSGAGAALTGNALEATDLNPASAASDSAGVYLGTIYPYRETNSKMPVITWNIPYDQYRFYLSSRLLKFDKIRGFDSDDQFTGYYGAYNLKAQTGVAGRIRNFFWGVSCNFVEQSISVANYHSVMMDIGAQYHVFKGLWAGMSATHIDIWTSSAYDKKNYTDPIAPIAIQGGMAYQMNLPKKLGAKVVIDGLSRNDEDLIIPAGVELNWREVLFFRTGYEFLRQEVALTFGAGCKWNRFLFDYAMERHTSLSPGHYFSLGIRW
ncbi:MAG: hypothetical protein HQK83_10435 [Fibrobacteria bacterium]|nr:hypothetical protein [Fibrobacteria bacterium]